MSKTVKLHFRYEPVSYTDLNTDARDEAIRELLERYAVRRYAIGWDGVSTQVTVTVKAEEKEEFKRRIIEHGAMTQPHWEN